MAMRETVSSIRAYLIVSGLLASLPYGALVVLSGPSIAAVFGLAGLVLALSYVYLGIRFKHLVTKKPNQIFLVLKSGAAFLTLIIVFTVAGGGLGRVVGFGIGLLLTLYLYVNSKRLATEAQQAASAPDVRPAQ